MYDKPSKIARENEENYDGFMNDLKGVTGRDPVASFLPVAYHF